jgi:Flp pilus assembly protein TadG
MSLISKLATGSRPRGPIGACGLVMRLVRAKQGSTAILVAAAFPALVGFGVLITDVPYLYYRHLLLRQTTQAAALAAANELTSYYTSGNGSSATIVSTGQSFSRANMPLARYGTVVPAGNVILGNLDSTNSTFTSLASSSGTSPNAVEIIGLNTTANGNPVPTLFGGIFGVSSVNMSSTAVATYATGQTFNTIILNDLSQSFSSEISNQQAADNAILSCVKNSSGSQSNFGITTFDGHSSIYQSLVQASTNMTSIQSKISSMNSCGHSGAPSCSGSNVASGIYSAIQQFSSPSYANAHNNIVVITDGVPNADAITYTRADGIYPTATSATPTCTSNCTDANLLTMAQNQAAAANAAGISISTIYYSGDTPAQNQAGYAAALKSLVTGTGVAMVAPSTAAISATFAGFCATMSSSVELIN